MRDKKTVLDRVFRISAEGKGLLFLSVLAAVIGTICSVIPYLAVYYIAKHYLLNGLVFSSEVWIWVVVSAIAILGNMLFTFLGSLGSHTVAFKILFNYRLHVMEHLGKLSMGFFSYRSSGSIQKIMDENIEKIEGFLAHMLPDMIGSLVVLLCLFTGIAYLSMPLAVTVIVSVFVGFGFQFLVFGGSKSKQIYADVALSSAKTTGAFSEYVKGMAEVKLFGKAGSITKGLAKHVKEYLSWEIQSYKRAAIPMSLYKSIVVSLLAFVLPVGIFLIVKNPTAETILSVLMALIIVPAIYDPLLALVEYATQMGMLSAGMEQIDEILNQPTLYKINQLVKVPDEWKIEFSHVSFSYGEAADISRKMALNDVSFVAKPGQITALVGASGSGKSTIGQLLLRFWEVNAGSISIGNVDIREIPYDQLMAYIAFVFQDSYLFADTIRGNITMNREVSDKELMEAAKKARCHDFIMRLPQGYDTKIGSGQMKLSGGEAQRISIARAILKDSPIIVLDEALAYSDAENENLIQEAIKQLLKDKTILIIAHRLQSVMTADQIIVLRDGSIIERGKHSELLELEGEYKEFWNLQHKADEWSIKNGGEEELS